MLLSSSLSLRIHCKNCNVNWTKFFFVSLKIKILKSTFSYSLFVLLCLSERQKKTASFFVAAVTFA